MKTTTIRSIWLAVAFLVGGLASLWAAEPRQEDATLAAKLVTAIQQADYGAFVVDGEAAVKQLKKEQFAAVAAQLAPRLTEGYELSYLGDLKQSGYRVTVWRLRFKDGRDDALATLSVKDGKVGGFWIR